MYIHSVCNAIIAYVLYLGPKRDDTVLETNVIKAAAIRLVFKDFKANSL